MLLARQVGYRIGPVADRRRSTLPVAIRTRKLSQVSSVCASDLLIGLEISLDWKRSLLQHGVG